MSDFLEKKEENPLTVTQLNEYIKSLIDGNALLSNVYLKGEISNFTNHRTGHFYFSIKDENSLIRAVMFKGAAMKIKFVPENGMKIVVRGSISLFVRDGQYQIYVTSMEPDGIGSLYLAFEQLKKKLQAEGLFDPRFKKPLPKIPLRVGVITSPTGAAVRDIINVLGRRFPLAKVVLYPSLVQGDDAAPQLIEGVKYFNATKSADVIILGRGGGSIEDLWAFNNEALARCVFDSVIPVISAVGHETDFTICDFVADMRAPTPSAAAELAVPDTMELMRKINNVVTHTELVVSKRINQEKQKVKLISERRIFTAPEKYFEDKKMMTAYLHDKLCHSLEAKLSDCRLKLASSSSKLDAMSPLATLSRGYLVGYNADKEKGVSSVNDVSIGERLRIRATDGFIYGNVTEIDKENV